jgi:hypothetical protein
MFTGFASENTPGVKVWDFTRTQSGSALPIASLEDDCAPNQIFFTGGSTNAISVYLPNASVAGKVITIRNEFTANTVNEQKLNVFDNAQNQVGWNYDIGQGQTIVFLSIDNLAAFRSSTVALVSCSWIILSGGQYYGGNNYGSSVLSGFANRTNGNSVFAVVAGGNTNRTNASNAAVIGGQSNTASGSNSFLGGGSTNTASGQNSAIVGGQGNAASSQDCAVIGSGGSSASGVRSVVAGSETSGASGTNSFIGGGSVHTANATNSSVVGGARGITRSIQGNTVSPASTTPITTTQGASQSALLVLGVQTTDATATVLRSNTAAATTTNQVILPNNSAYFFQGQVIAGKTAAGDTKGWTIEGVIKRGANAASTALVGTPTVTSMYADAGAVTWVVAVTADTTNGGLAITVTGQASTTIRWVAQIRTTEMTF